MTDRQGKQARLAWRGSAMAMLAAGMLLASAPARAGENGWSYYPRWEEGCLITYYYAPVRTTISGKPGPAGYRRYERRADLHICLPD